MLPTRCYLHKRTERFLVLVGKFSPAVMKLSDFFGYSMTIVCSSVHIAERPENEETPTKSFRKNAKSAENIDYSEILPRYNAR